MKFFRKPYRYAAVYALTITLFTVYVLVDTFVIEHRQEEVITADNSTADSTDSVTSGANDDGTYQSCDNGVSSPVITDTSYKDDNISINISTFRKYETQVYAADIKVSSADYLKTAFADNTFGRNIKARTSEIAQDNNAVFAVNGDYCGFRDYGFVIRNSHVYRTVSGDGDALVISDDGSMSSADENESDAQELLKNGAVQVLSFGPVLVNDSCISVSENDEVARAKTSNPRTAAGMIEPLHYIFIVADGRTDKSEGLSLFQLAEIMKEYGCTFAYNLDGGGSSAMWFNGKIINHPTDGRKDGERSVSDIVYIGY